MISHLFLIISVTLFYIVVDNLIEVHRSYLYRMYVCSFNTKKSIRNLLTALLLVLHVMIINNI